MVKKHSEANKIHVSWNPEGKISQQMAFNLITLDKKANLHFGFQAP